MLPVMEPSPRTATLNLRSGLRASLPAALAALAAIVVFACTLRGTYIYDDQFVVHSDPRISDPHLWGQFWTKPYMPTDKLYRPLVSMSFAIQYWLHGDRPLAFHLVNILLHAAVSGAVAELGRRLAGFRAGLIAGLLFAIHPVHVEAVAGLVGRSELMCGLATIVGLCIFVGGPLTPKRMWALAGCCIIAVLSKEQGLLFPLLLLALVPFRRLTIGTMDERRYLKPFVALLCYVLAAYIFLRELTIGFWWDRQFLEWVLNPMVRSHGVDRLLMPVVLVGRYLRLLVFPTHLSLDYGGNAIGWHASMSDPYLYLGFFAIVLWLAAAIWSIRGRRWAELFCLLGFALAYGMIGNIVALIGTIFAERLMYLPSAFFLLLIGILARPLPLKVIAPLLALLIVSGAIRAESYAKLWNTPLALFQYCIASEPGSERVYELAYKVYSERGDWVSARREAGAAMAAVPESHDAYQLCAEADLALGEVADARRTIDRGLEICKGNDHFYLLLWQDKVYQEPLPKGR
jgi:hypothetical protein